MPRAPLEKEANGRELKGARISSWEHGLLRTIQNEASNGSSALKNGRYLVARGEADAPDIDGRVYVRAQAPKSNLLSQKHYGGQDVQSLTPELSQFADVKIIGHTDYDLIAELAKSV